MSLDGSLIVGVLFVALIVLTLAVMSIDLLRASKEWWLDVCADALTILRTYSWRRFRRRVLNAIGMFCSALAQRCFERADAPETPSAGKLKVVVRRQWESKQIVLERDKNLIKASFGGRVVRVKV